MSYPDRYQAWAESGQPLTVYVPAPRVAIIDIDKGSAIVGSPWDPRKAQAPEQLIRVDFEGNRYGAENLRAFINRVQCAAGRHVTHYPTVARAVLPETSLIPVGTFDGTTVTITNRRALTAWLGHDALDEEGCC